MVDIEQIISAALKKWGSQLSAIAIFGSFARRQEYKDIDILIVLEKIDKNRIERIGDIAEIKRVLDFPADILLFSKEECLDNFKGHNPLFLDIAIEGEIIYDSGFLGKLIDDIRLEIKKKKIKKEFSRWIFPVKDRIPTPLSEITNKDWANYWLDDAQRDLLAAEYLSHEKLYERAVYHCQQAVEKAVKAILMCFGAYEKTHYVASILRKEIANRDIEEYSEELNIIMRIAEELEPHVSLCRYPGISMGKVWLPSKEYTEEIAKIALEDTRKALRACGDFVKWWFEK
ncbi:MAG: HEPN domain-containing protein [Euryarchaeota archaeon]|nr:HEPN domain-containing protein [Euryarchaeota archaeon]MCG2727731.1 HEPN domain-containing protein [Candidatus Methanoperedenaceae archaeon]